MTNASSQENSLPNVEEKLDLIRYSRKRGGHGYTIAVKESAALIELALKELIRRYLLQLKDPAQLKFNEEQNKIGKGNKTYRNFTMGQLAGLIRESRFLDALAETTGMNLTRIRMLNLDQIVQFRNDATHDDYRASAAEAELVWVALKAFLEALGMILVEEAHAGLHDLNPSVASSVIAPPAVTTVIVPNSRTVVPAPLPPVKTNSLDGAELILIPAGEFSMGSEEYDHEKPIHRVFLDSYYISRTPVTVRQYLAFCAATGHAKPLAPSWGLHSDHPVVNVTWEDAGAYCTWAGGRLPTEAEWEKAARGTDGRQYPWGEEWDATKCANIVGMNFRSGTVPVGSYPSGASPYGVLDMAGNVWEWCWDWYTEGYYGECASAGVIRNPQGPATSEEGRRVLRGGSWGDDDARDFRCANRGRFAPDSRGDDGGFRCVVRSDTA